MVSAYLLGLVLLLVVYLIRKKVSRHAILEIVETSVVFFWLLLIISYRIADKITLNGSDSFWVYVPPIFPVAILAFWLSRKADKR